MEIEAFIKKMKDVYETLMDFIEAPDDCESKFQRLILVLNKQEILQNEEEVRLLFKLISKITDNHHRTSNFFDKLEKIFGYLVKDKPTAISHFIPNHTKYNKRVLFLLLEKNLLKPDEPFLLNYKQSKQSYSTFSNENSNIFQSYYYYLYPVIKEFIKIYEQKQIEDEIKHFFEEDLSVFKEKCQIGENDSYICSLIREDSVEEFVAYVNRTNLKLTSKIKQSIFETNSFLIDKEPTLIEYATFFGSIQIIQYLKYNQVPLTSSLWLYAIHSNNAELIHFLEENEVKPKKNIITNTRSFYNYNNQYRTNESFDDVLNESIKCHHNAISDYIKDNLLDQIISNDQNQFNESFGINIADSLNFYYFPNDIESLIFKSGFSKGFKIDQLCVSIKVITIPSSVTSIEYNTFSNCRSLTQIIIPSSVTSIGDYAFYYCKSLTQISIPSSVTSIGKNAFSNCSSLTQISIPSSVTSINNSAFSFCTSLTQITIPSSVNSIRIYAFSNCKSLAQISIPSSVNLIRDFAFYFCTSLTQISIPSSVTSIGKDTFSNCTSLTQITIPSSVTSIGINAFSNCTSLTQISISSSVTSIGSNTFSNCTSLTQVSIPSSVTSIGSYAFYYCESLTQMSIPSSVDTIGNYAFSNCTSLTKITIPSSVTYIGDYAFSNCKSLTQISIPSSVTFIGANIFLGCALIPPELQAAINKKSKPTIKIRKKFTLNDKSFNFFD